MFVGDSLSRNAWVSLCCLLHAAVPTSNFSLKATKATTKVTFMVNRFTAFKLMQFF